MGLPKNVVNRIFALGLGALYQSLPKTRLFDLFWRDTVAIYVVYSVLRPDELMDSHNDILHPPKCGANHNTSRTTARPQSITPPSPCPA